MKKHLWALWLIIASAIIGLLGYHWGDNWFGIISSVTGAMCVILTAKGYRSAFIVGTINTIMYAVIAFHAKYYGDFMLNALYYLPMQFIGWKAWSNNRSDTGEIYVNKLENQQAILLVLIATFSILGYGALLKIIGGALPFVDSTSTVLSIMAMYLSVKCYKEQWTLWIIINVVSIAMWAISIRNGGTDYATLIMWTVYLLNSIWGHRHWTKLSKKKKRKPYAGMN